jgi:hypothetical protein
VHGKWVAWSDRIKYGAMHHAGPRKGVAFPPALLAVMHFRDISTSDQVQANTWNATTMARDMCADNCAHESDWCGCGWCALRECDYLARVASALA